MSARIECAGLQVDPEIHALLENEILPGTGVEATAFWEALADIVKTFTPRNRELLTVRDEMQAKISTWHKAHPGEIMTERPTKPCSKPLATYYPSLRLSKSQPRT